MLEQLYTRKVIVALMALILAANGMLLYQLWGAPSATQTADTPSSSESPQTPNPPQDERDGEAEDGEPGEEAPPEDESGGQEESAQSDPDTEGSRQGGQPSDSGAAEGQSEPPGTPFGSQYDPPPTVPGDSAELASSGLGGSGDFDPGASGSGAGGGQSESGLARIQMVVLSAFYEVEESGPGDSSSGESGSEANVLPATSGFGGFAVALSVAAMAGGMAIAVFGRRSRY